MTHARNESNWIARLYAALVEASATAVAVHYDAPWKRANCDRAAKV
ncbi:hypothetical protein [Sphingopyxis sp. QXT-31]|nr:hypothetical protein [Sphingopyxis sp. QXT-31]